MKKLIMTVVALLLAICTCFSLVGCGAVKDVEYVKKQGKLIVGITDYKPMDYKEEGSDKWTGFDAELSEEFAKSLGVTCEFVELADWDAKTIEIDSKNIDLIWNGMTADAELGKKIDFSTSYALNYQCAVVKADSTIDSVEAIKGTTISVESGSAGNNVAKADLGKQDTDLNIVKSQVKALLEVVSGASNVAIIDYTLAQSVVGKGDYAGLKIVDTTKVKFNEEVFAVGLRKNSDLKAELDKFLKAKYNDGSLQKLADKYVVVLNKADLSK